MANARTTLRDAFYTRLLAATAVGQPLAGYLVESSRIEPVDDAQAGVAMQPYVLVYADDAIGQTLSGGLGTGATFLEQSAVSINLDCGTTGGTGVAIEAALDALEDTLRTLLLGDQTLLDAMRTHPQVAVGTGVFKASGNRLRGGLVMTFACESHAVEVP